MRNLNVRMAAQKLSGYQFATCCYCLLNTATLEMTYSRAGHPYPVIIKPGGRLAQLELRGSLLGVFDEAEFAERTIHLEPGDKLLVYSDGAERFIGAYDEQAGFCFTEQLRLLQDSPITEIIDRLTAFAHTRKADIHAVDDITAVGLEIL
jgi:serine phosphatase RsbU (regulator of sigma subunit)